MLSRQKIAALSMQRQHFFDPVSADDYPALFRALSPVSTEYWAAPGSPPVLWARVAEHPDPFGESLRAERAVIKIRCGSGVSYICADEFSIFAAAYAAEKPCTPAENDFIALFEREGPMSIGAIREFTGLRAKDITPLLHRLQEKFLIVEDQCDNQPDRAWYRASEYFSDDIAPVPREEALEMFVRRFAYAQVFFDETMLHSFYRLPRAVFKKTILKLLDEQVLEEDRTDRMGGYLLASDREELNGIQASSSVFLLHRNDPYVRAAEPALKERFLKVLPAGDEIIFYFLLDGALTCAVTGKFHNGPFELHDIVSVLPPREIQPRVRELLLALSVQTEDFPVRVLGKPAEF